MSQLATWPPADVALALAELAIEADTGRYGESLAEATDPRADPNAYGPYRYVPEGPFTNQAERTAKLAEEQWRKDMPEGTSTAGLFWTVRKVEQTPLSDPAS
ncbi:hypothetical protein [Agromyces aureus]|uniref:Uncharacterized protein n=1 Tax=Agromyces aureus TaxID=453304 RepID=A0A191WF20_9MICO|nr:hypothetical protein [Agromyces aureus]ANJ26822.1 hypothetical protein ATC03_08920 [Agromyces aureus]